MLISAIAMLIAIYLFFTEPHRLLAYIITCAAILAMALNGGEPI